MAIISASRRTDIPAFYAEWFMARLREGYAQVPNPYNANQFSTVSLKSQDVDCIVFWTKNAKPLIPHIKELQSSKIPFYFQYTVTGLPKQIEPKTPSLDEQVDTIQELSELIGPGRIVWRFDPIVVSSITPPEWVVETFQSILLRLNGNIRHCVISFLDFYGSVYESLADLRTKTDITFKDLTTNSRLSNEIAEKISLAAKAYKIPIYSCSELIDLTAHDILPSRCIDADLINEMFGGALRHIKDKGQRKSCGCAKSKDIGCYSTCHFSCTYCYASSHNADVVSQAVAKHNPSSSSLLGTPPDKPMGADQLTLF